MQPPQLSEKFIEGIGPYSCADVTEFINSLDGNASVTINDFEAICNIIQLFDFDKCRETKNKTFNYFEILLKKFHREIIQHSSLSISLTYFAECFNFLKQAFDLEDDLSFFAKMQQNVDIKSEFFRRYGGNTTSNKNIYDLAIHKKQHQRVAQGAEIRSAKFMGGRGKRQPNGKKASRIHFLKKHFRISRKNKSRSRRRKTSKTSKRN